MDEYEAILNCETIDIYNYIAGLDPVPPSLDTPMMAKLREYCQGSPLGTAPSAYAAAKAKANLI